MRPPLGGRQLPLRLARYLSKGRLSLLAPKEATAMPLGAKATRLPCDRVAAGIGLDRHPTNRPLWVAEDGQQLYRLCVLCTGSATESIPGGTPNVAIIGWHVSCTQRC